MNVKVKGFLITENERHVIVSEGLDSAEAVFLDASGNFFVLETLFRGLVNEAEGFLFGDENFVKRETFAVLTD